MSVESYLKCDGCGERHPLGRGELVALRDKLRHVHGWTTGGADSIDLCFECIKKAKHKDMQQKKVR